MLPADPDTYFQFVCYFIEMPTPGYLSTHIADSPVALDKESALHEIRVFYSSGSCSPNPVACDIISCFNIGKFDQRQYLMETKSIGSLLAPSLMQYLFKMASDGDQAPYVCTVRSACSILKVAS